MRSFTYPSLITHPVTVLFATLLVWLSSASAQVAATPSVLQQQLDAGAYLARAGNCGACHTAPGGLPFAGGLAMATPFGTVYSTNITPDATHGIGNYSFEQFNRAMRQGIANDGDHLYPAMPYTAFARISAGDMQSLYAYFMHGVIPAPSANRANELRWPFSMRSLLAGWNLLFLRKGEYVADPERSATWNRGAYLVQGVGHCSACHTPRGIAGQEKGSRPADGTRYMAGAVVDNWLASNLTADFATGLHDWSGEEIADYLKTGRSARSAAAGPMAQVVSMSTQYLRDDDLAAIADYLKSLPGTSVKGASSRVASVDAAATKALRAGTQLTPGARLYLDNCNACHRSDGAGMTRTFPALARSSVVNTADPTSLIHLVLTGSAMPSTRTAPSALAMPDFAWRLSNQQVAEVLSFVRGSWGNQAPAVAASDVEQLRKALSH